jgi:hypothetical protein
MNFTSGAIKLSLADGLIIGDAVPMFVVRMPFWQRPLQICSKAVEFNS